MGTFFRASQKVYSHLFEGVLKGSEESLMHSERHLSLEAYENFSSRRQSTFASHRYATDSVGCNTLTTYLNIAETGSTTYLPHSGGRRRRKVTWTPLTGKLALVALISSLTVHNSTHAILGCLQADIQIIGQPVDFLYVDEAQDNLLIDALSMTETTTDAIIDVHHTVLRFICCNPDGLFWAGDTAQTISVGSSFRFNDLRAFIHRIDKRVAEDAPAFIAQEPPALFELVVNYRSHGGIVSCAHSIIGLIKNFWPNSIDNLAEERGVVEGGKPVFFYGNARYDQFLFGSNDNRIEFGAKQGIIVRDEESKQRLCDEVGSKIGLVYTVFEAKGLEFDDVLIFDFFSDSTVTHNQWRVVLNAMPKHEDGCSDTPAPAFDSIRHAGVCADLKSLYVAVTRARKNLWIADRSDKGEPMRVGAIVFSLCSTEANRSLRWFGRPTTRSRTALQKPSHTSQPAPREKSGLLRRINSSSTNDSRRRHSVSNGPINRSKPLSQLHITFARLLKKNPSQKPKNSKKHVQQHTSRQAKHSRWQRHPRSGSLVPERERDTSASLESAYSRLASCCTPVPLW